jgi:hypothetical protein
MRKSSWIALGILIMASGQATAQPRWSSKEPGNVFLAGSPVRFRVIGTQKRLPVRVLDYRGQVVRQGQFPANNVNLGELPTGYYEIAAEGETDSEGTAFVVVPNPRPRGEGRLAVDAALSWLIPRDRYEEGAELIRRAGFRWVRDRISWGEVEAQPGKYVWGRYEKSAQAQEKRGLRVYQVFHDVPKWARSDGAVQRFPDDLRTVYRFARAAAQKFRGKVKAWEVWNEADIPVFSTDVPAEYAAFLKAAYLGFKTGDSGALVLQTSMAHASGRFGEGLIANGTAAFYDLYNYHIYATPGEYEARAKTHREHLQKAGAAGRPIWLTEAGIPQKATNNTLTREQKRIQAEFIPRSYVASLLSGTEKHFFFVFPHYLENGVAFGVLDADLRPYPGYAALATLTDALGAARYRGSIRFRQPGLHLHVFDDGEQDVLIAWTDRDSVEIPLNLSPGGQRSAARAQVLDVVGSPSPLLRERGETPRLSISPSPVYLRMPRGAFVDAVEPLQPPGSLDRAVSRVYGRPEIVVRLRIAESKPDKAEEALRVPTSRPLPLEVQVYNFGNRAFNGTITLTAGTGLTLSRQAIVLKNVPPMGLRAEETTLTLASGTARATLGAVAQDTDGARSSPTHLELLP